MHGETHHEVEVVTQNGLQSVSVWSQERLPSNQSARTMPWAIAAPFTRVGYLEPLPPSDVEGILHMPAIPEQVNRRLSSQSGLSRYEWLRRGMKQANDLRLAIDSVRR